MQFTTLLLAAVAGLASAQTGGNGGSSGTGVKKIAVLVGKTGTTYSPDNIRANVGDVVQFQFMGGNHTVTQSTFAQPCQPINAFMSNVTGFHSGFIPAAASQAMGMIPTWEITINDTTPIWVYCAQAKHCEGGMSLVINENSSSNKTLTNYRAAASQATTVVPGQPGSGTNGQPGSGTAGSSGSNLAIPSTVGLLVFAVGVLFL